MANDAKFNFYLNRQGARGQKGEKGDQGFSPSITVNTDTADEYTLLIQNEYNNFVTDNIRPTYDDRGGTYVRVDRDNNVQYFGSADIATTANYGEVKLAQASDLASTVDVGNSNVITVELLKTWFGGQLADNLVTTTNNVTIQGQKIFATPTRFMDTVRIGNRLLVAQEDTGTITFDSGEDGTLIGTHLTSTGDANFNQNVTVDGIATIEGGLNVAGNAVISSPQLGNTTVSGSLTTKADINIQGQKVHLQDTNPTMYLKNMNGVNEIEIFRGLFTAGNPSPADNYLNLGHSQLQLNLTGKAIKANGKDVATADTVEAMQSDLNIAKQDIIEAQGDIDNLQMNKQNKLTAGTGITIDADNVISATGGSTTDSYTKSETDALLSKKNDNIFDISKFTVVGNPTITDDGVASGFSGVWTNYIKTAQLPSISSGNNFEIKNKKVKFNNEIASLYYSANKFNISYYNHYLNVYISSDGNGWDIANNVNVNKYLKTDTYYNIRFIFTGEKYQVAISTDDDNYTYYDVATSTTKMYFPTGSQILLSPEADLFKEIDLKHFSITVDGKEVFNGLMESTKPIYDAIKANNTELSEFKTETSTDFSAVNSALNEKANLSDLALKQNKLTAGQGIAIDADNVISATGGLVDLPIASSTTLGGIKVGENLTISENGTLSATGGGGATIDDSTTATTSVWSSSKTNTEINTVANEVVQVQGEVASLDELISTMSNTINSLTDRISALEANINGGNA